MFESILCQVTEYDSEVLETLIELCVEIAREGREGRRIGTLFTLFVLPAVYTVLAKDHLAAARSTRTREIAQVS